MLIIALLYVDDSNVVRVLQARVDEIHPYIKDYKGALSWSVIAGVKYSAIFLGFGRGGTTLVGALLDGHSNIVLATDYQLFIKWPQYRTYHQEISQLYSALHQ